MMNMGDWVKGTVVRFQTKGRDMKFPAIAEIRAYWEALRQGRLVPQRSDIDPRGIERALEYAFVLERVAPQVARFRLAGLHLTDLMGMEVRGMPLSTLFSPMARARLAEALGATFAGPAIVELKLTAETGLGKPALEARMILLPLHSDLGDLTRVLGGLVADGHIGRAPRRFDIADVIITPLTAGATPQARPALQPQGLAEAPADFIPAGLTPAVRTVGHLRLVKTDR